MYLGGIHKQCGPIFGFGIPSALAPILNGKSRHLADFKRQKNHVGYRRPPIIILIFCALAIFHEYLQVSNHEQICTYYTLSFPKIRHIIGPFFLDSRNFREQFGNPLPPLCPRCPRGGLWITHL